MLKKLQNSLKPVASLMKKTNAESGCFAFTSRSFGHVNQICRNMCNKIPLATVWFVGILFRLYLLIVKLSRCGHVSLYPFLFNFAIIKSYQNMKCLHKIFMLFNIQSDL